MEVTIPVSDTPSFASTREALSMLHAVMGYLSADAGEMATEAQAECLLALEQLDAVKTATRARVLGAFNAGQGYAADADYSPRSWLIHRTRITKGAAAAHLAWVRRTAAHPRVAAALADGEVSESYARKIWWDDKRSSSACGRPRRNLASGRRGQRERIKHGRRQGSERASLTPRSGSGRSARQTEMPVANTVLTTVVDTWSRSWMPRHPIWSSGLLRWPAGGLAWTRTFS